MAGMTEDELASSFDDLDAFFSAAAKSDGKGLRQAADNMSSPASPAASGARNGAAATPPTTDDASAALAGKFIAVDGGGNAESGDPFVLIPAHIHVLLPWWGWTAIIVSLAMLAAGIMLFPILRLDRLAGQLASTNPDSARTAMRQFILSGDKRAVGRLYDLAASPELGMNTRLRAVDTLGLMPHSEADQALLRLELAEKSGTPVQEAASATRRQRELDRTRVRYR